MPPSLSLKILFEDRHCLVVAKPSRLLTGSDKTGDETLLSQVRAYNAARQAEGKKGYVAPLHFLDRPVSGVVMYAVSSKAASRLAADFRGGKIEKVYYAVVTGRPAQRSATLEDWLLKDKSDNVVTVVPAKTEGAKPCLLDYEMVGEADGLVLLVIRPKTGRSHQIRVQLASRGMSIYGDVKYGALRAWDGTIALHARRVHFTHPVSGERMTVSAPLPDAWSELVRPDLWPKDTDV